MSSSEDEEVVNTSDTISLHRLFEELQNTQVNIRDTRTENRGIHQQLVKLTKKISHFNSLLSSVLIYPLFSKEKYYPNFSSFYYLE
jgi:hypothetical protein